MTEQLNIAELRRMHEAATPGYWQYDDGVTDGEGTPDAERGKAAWITAKGNVLIAEPSGCDPKEPCVPSLAEMDANGKFIVAARNALPALLDAAEERDRLKGSAHTAFVMGADWARYQITQCTSFPSERDEASAEAEKRFPYVPRIYEVLNKELTTECDALRTEIEAAKLILPVCCGSIADAADTLRQERDEWKALYQTAVKHAAKNPF